VGKPVFCQIPTFQPQYNVHDYQHRIYSRYCKSTCAQASACAYLKVHLHKIFDFCFFFIKAPTRCSDSYPKFVSNIKSNSPRYLNYSSLCVDSINVELIFASSYLQTFRILWLILAPFQHLMVNFSIFCPFKGA
jgi:hypothetical protein